MSAPLYVSASAAMTRLDQLEVVANNLANANTAGFKADRAVFHSALEASLLGVDGRPMLGPDGQVYVRTHQVMTDHRPGPTQRTGAPLDAAIAGPGFFVVETPAGVRYTRAGNFRVGPEQSLATAQGFPVLGSGGPIAVGSSPVEIGRGGEVVDASGDVLGRLRVVEFDDPGLLVKEGDGLFRAPASAVDLPVAEPQLQPGEVEGSNVQPVRELAAMMILQRSYDAAMQALQADDAATERLIQEVSQ